MASLGPRDRHANPGIKVPTPAFLDLVELAEHKLRHLPPMIFVAAQRTTQDTRATKTTTEEDTTMKSERFSDLTVDEIMRRWPSTIGVFIDLQLHCIGCPIGIFHTLSDAAIEHGIGLEDLADEVSAAIDADTRAGPARPRRRSSSGDAIPLREASACRPRQVPHVPKP